jgi:hypothetical protein
MCELLQRTIEGGLDECSLKIDNLLFVNKEKGLQTMKSALALFLLAFSIIVIACKDSTSPLPTTKPYTLPTALNLDAHASRTDDGRIVISGTTNLPDGIKIWVEVEDGRLPLGAAKVVASDDTVIVRNGQFASAPLWLSVPNTRFTRKGWPKGIQVNDRLKPFPEGKFKVHFESYLNSAWQTRDVLTALGGEDGKKLSGPILKETDPDIIDSPRIVDYLLTLPFPPISAEAKAINLVRAAILTVPDEGRSAGDIQANIDLYMSSPGLRAGTEWTAKAKSATVFEVSYDFINGGLGETQAIWTANIASGEVKYLNKDAKMFSWTPDY